MADFKQDKELELYRNLLENPTEYKDGFGWSTVAGIFFCGLVMLPGSIYLGLMSGAALGPAAQWVTVILFNEIARRSLKKMSKQNLVVLLHAAGVIMAANALYPGGPASQLVWRAFLVDSEAIRDAGMRDFLPDWWVPDPDSPAITERNLFHPDWFVPLGLMLAMSVLGLIKRFTLGYFFFRLTSDIEQLPYPMAPIAAQGSMAMAEADEKGKEGEDPGAAFFDRSKRGQIRKKSERWRLFSLGAVLGITFGFFQVGIPALTGLFLAKPFFLIPQPFWDTTTLTESFLPATPTGVAIDAGIIMVGMVIPFWAVLGSLFAIVLTLVLNPILHSQGVLTEWQPGMDTVNTAFANNIDFYMSFGIGSALGIAIVSIYQTIRDVRRKLKQLRQDKDESAKKARSDMWSTPAMGRGDFPLWVALLGYLFAGTVIIVLTYFLLMDTKIMGDPGNRGALWSVMIFMVIFTFVYNPLVSYINARLLGIAGQSVEIPHLKEVAFIASGAKGLGIWMAPVPIENYGGQAQAFRIKQLTGTSFISLLKTDLVAMPILFVLSMLFWMFVWQSAEVPSSAFPYAQTYWEYQSKNTALLWSSTFVSDPAEQRDWQQTEFGNAVHFDVMGYGTALTVVAFIVLSGFGLPIMFVYGMVRGLGDFPHMMILEIVGAVIGRTILSRKFGRANWLRMAPTILAGYFTGVGLIGMALIALELISKAVSAAPF